MAEARRFAITPQLDIEQILLDAQHRWLRPAEICEILRNFQKFRIAPEPPNKPSSGSLFLFDRKVLRYFRKDGHNWRKKKDGKTVKEAHERLKSGSVDVLHCYYAHGEENENFQRRSYWMLEEGLMHIVLVHYLEVKGTKASYRSIRETEDTAQVTHLDSPVCSNSFTHQSHGPSLATDGESANSGRVSVCEDDESDNCQASSRYHSHLELQQYGDGPVMDARLLNPYVLLAASNNRCDYQRSQTTEPESGFYSVVPGEISKEYSGEVGHGLTICEPRTQLELTSLDEILQHSITGFQNANFQASVASMQPAALEVNPDKRSLAIRGLDTDGYNINQEGVATAQGHFLSMSRDINDRALEESLISSTDVDSLSTTNVKVKKDPFIGRINNDPSFLKQPSLDLADIVGEGLKKYDSFSRWMSKELEEVEDTDMKSSSGLYWDTADSENVADSSMPNQELLDPYLMTPSLSQDQLFSIIDFSPSWGYTGLGAKVLVTGRFLKDKQDVDRCKWSCMFGEVEVPAEILADGVLRCHAPPHKPGRFPFYVTCSNRLACSELREFEYCVDHAQNMETSDSSLSITNELNFHIRLERLLSLGPAENCFSSDISEKSNLGSKSISLSMETDEEWHDLFNITRDGGISPDSAKDRLLEKLLKDKLHMWLLRKASEDGNGKGPNVLDREGQGVLHLAAAIGYDWAIKPTIAAGVSINFRDVHGWTALHWAAFCGRERTVGTLIALGAAPGALTDPTPEFPTGRTPADLASAKKHKGIAGFLAEASLTSHLSTLKLKEVEANDTPEISDQRNNEAVVGTRIPQFSDGEELATSMEESLNAIRNAAQAAARIHQVFRVQSFQRKKLIEYDDDKSGISDQRALSFVALKASRLGQHDLPVHAAATKIQTKFRGWKGRKEFLIIRQRIVKIQAHIRGHRVRKQYKKVVWSVGIVEKAILRWRRKGIGLRGFRSEGLLVGPAAQNQSSKEDDYDFLKEGRKQAEARTEKALARVKSMAQYPEARDQYRRLLTVVMELQETKAMQEDRLNDSEAADGNLTIEVEEIFEGDVLMPTADKAERSHQ